jgi:hypothetical protein
MGYFLRFGDRPYEVDLSRIDKSLYENIAEDDLIEQAAQLLHEAVAKNFTPDKKHVVPISGGLDSRAVLSTLLEFTEAENIWTYTFGSPKTFNYEIGNKVAKAAGTNHRRFNMTQIKYSMDELLNLSKKFQHQTVLFYHQPFREIEKYFGDFTIWSGFMLDMSSGCHSPKQPSESVEAAKIRFLKKNNFVKTLSLMNCEGTDLLELIEWFGVEKDQLSYDEQLDIENRQLKYNAPHLLCAGFDYRIPGLEPALFHFMCSLPERFRLDQFLYRKMLLKLYPVLYGIENTRTFGIPLGANRYRSALQIAYLITQKRIRKIWPSIIDLDINYIDFDRGLREREDLQRIVHENILDLKKRKIVDWVDIDGIWKKHMNKSGNHADALLILASLEIHLKAGRKL